MGNEDRGFASMDPEKRRAIQSAGGTSAHRSGRAHQWTTEEARAAGRKGGLASKASKAKRQTTDDDNTRA